MGEDAFTEAFCKPLKDEPEDNEQNTTLLEFGRWLKGDARGASHSEGARRALGSLRKRDDE